MSDRVFAALFMVFTTCLTSLISESRGHIPDWIRMIFTVCAVAVLMQVLVVRLVRNRGI